MVTDFQDAQLLQQGLSSAEAEQRLRTVGPNVIIPRRHDNRLLRWLRSAADPMAILLVIAGATYLALGEYRDALVMGLALVPIVAMNTLLEGRAEHALERLRQLTEPTVTVLRDGQWQSMMLDLLVPGDLIRVQEGDVLPADCRLLAGSDVVADESALTGESIPVSKEPTTEDRLFAGSVLVSGRGVAEVVLTGPTTEYGKVGALLATIKPTPTPLQQSIGQLVRRLFMLAGILCVVVVVLGLARGIPLRDAFLGGVSLAMAAIPEEFPVVYALYLTLGVWRMAKHEALIRRMVGVETLGSTSVICTDKTGTLTFGRMAVARVWAPAGAGLTEDEVVAGAALASEPQPFDPMEQAIVERAPQSLYDGRRLVHEYPFDSLDKYMSHIWQEPGGQLRMYAKGSFEGIAKRCSWSGEELSRAEEANRGLAQDGIRVLAVAERQLDHLSRDRSRDEASLRFLGLVGLADPLRPEVPAAMDECQQAGIRVVMITGDHPLTARAIAQQAGVARHPRTISTNELDFAGPEEWEAAAAETDVFARITPAEKLHIVQAFKRRGEVVAMTGDGINDAPALRAADIGVAMGHRGTEVAREAATMVLLDDNFGTIVAAVREGRRILANVRRAFAYLVAFHVPILLSAIAAPLAGLPLLLGPAHLVWLELIIHPISSLAFEQDQPDPNIMRQPPRSRWSPLISGRRLTRAAVEGIVVFAGVWGAFIWALSHGWPEPLARNFAFTTLLLAQVGLVVVERSDRGVWEAGGRGNRLLPWLLTLTALSTLLPYVPVAGDLLHLAPLPPGQWLWAVGLAFVSTAWTQLLWLPWPGRPWRLFTGNHS